jgi:hypothetical protein
MSTAAARTPPREARTRDETWDTHKDLSHETGCFRARWGNAPIFKRMLSLKKRGGYSETAHLRGWWSDPCGFESRLRHHVETIRAFRISGRPFSVSTRAEGWTRRESAAERLARISPHGCGRQADDPARSKRTGCARSGGESRPGHLTKIRFNSSRRRDEKEAWRRRASCPVNPHWRMRVRAGADRSGRNSRHGGRRQPARPPPERGQGCPNARGRLARISRHGARIRPLEH